MKNLNKFKLGLAVVLLLPAFASAQLGETKSLLTNALEIVEDLLIPIAFTLALLYFFWGVAKYIKSEGQGKDEGKRIMIWGVVALFVMASIWGLVNFIYDELLGASGVSDTVRIPKIVP